MREVKVKNKSRLDRYDLEAALDKMPQFKTEEERVDIDNDDDRVKKEAIAKLIKLFKSLDLNKSLTEIYSELDSEYEELRDLVADLYMLVHEEPEDIAKEMADVEEQQRYYTARLYKTELS